MPVCDYCGKSVTEIHEQENGRRKLRLCLVCQAEYEFKHAGDQALQELCHLQQPWYRRWWRKITGS